MSVYSSERNAGGCYSGYDSYDAFGEFGQCATYELDQDMVWGPGDYSLDVSSGELISGSSGGSSDASGSSGAEFSWKTVDYGGSSVDLF